MKCGIVRNAEAEDEATTESLNARPPARRTPSSVVQVGAAEGNGPGQDQGPTWNNLGSACLGLVSFSFCTVLIFLLYCTDFPSVLC